MNVSKTQSQLIKKAIKDSELKAQIEIVPVILSQSDYYPVAHFRLGILMAIVFAILLYLSPLHFINPLWYLTIQLPGFFTGYMLAYLPQLRRYFITKEEIEEEVYQRSVELFFEEKIHMTKDHNGVLILVSLLERKIEIILDHGLLEKCPPESVAEVTKHFAEKMKAGETYEAMRGCIDELSHLFENYFPRQTPKKFSDNEIKDDLIFRK